MLRALSIVLFSALMCPAQGFRQSNPGFMVLINNTIEFHSNTVSGLEYWFRSTDMPSTNDGDYITSWADLSGLGRDLFIYYSIGVWCKTSAINGIVFPTAYINGNPDSGLEYFSDQDILTLLPDAPVVGISMVFSVQDFSEALHQGKSWALFSSMTPLDYGVEGMASYYDNGGQEFHRLSGAGGNYGYTGSMPTWFPPTNWFMARHVFNSTNAAIYTNTVLATIGSPAGITGTLTGFYLGNCLRLNPMFLTNFPPVVESVHPWFGHMAEILVYSGDDVRTNFAKVENYLLNRYNIHP